MRGTSSQQLGHGTLHSPQQPTTYPTTTAAASMSVDCRLQQAGSRYSNSTIKNIKYDVQNPAAAIYSCGPLRVASPESCTLSLNSRVPPATCCRQPVRLHVLSTNQRYNMSNMSADDVHTGAHQSPALTHTAHTAAAAEWFRCVMSPRATIVCTNCAVKVSNEGNQQLAAGTLHSPQQPTTAASMSDCRLHQLGSRSRKQY
jgi:hypothetical protein